MLNRLKNNSVKVISVIAFMMVALISCQKEEVFKNKAELSLAEVPYSHVGQFMKIETQESWSISVAYPEGIDPWCTLNTEQGEGSKNNIMLTYEINESDKLREATINILFGRGEKIALEFKQLAKEEEKPDNPDPDNPDKPVGIPNWKELPVISTEGDLMFVSHDVKIGSKNVRNYSMQYDKANKIALWVAYPLAGFYMGSQKRTDAWGYDPKIPDSAQPNLSRGFSSMVGLSGYDRGHQLPSASRTANRTANAQTFYFSNMTAQYYQLNQKVWAQLEGKVRAYISTCDTLYVITGPVLKTESDTKVDIIYDRSGKVFTAKPKAYFKVLLKYSIVSNQYKAIGFWYENRAYSHSYPNSSDAQTVAEIEKRTGLKFFTNLSLSEAELTKLKTEFAPSSWGL